MMRFNPYAMGAPLTDLQYAMRNPVDPNVVVDRSQLPPDVNTYHPNDIMPLLNLMQLNQMFRGSGS